MIPTTNHLHTSEMSRTSVTVAIVDDHPLALKSLRVLLNIFGYSVVLEAENGSMLVDKLDKANLPDLCFLDLDLPLLDGFETTKYLKEKWPFIKVVIFSLNDCIYSQEKAAKAGADLFISKFAEVEDIKESLEKLMRK